ncbi:hypothetical protein D7319_06445 [Streptomyces radicis]|uniref:Uncharacterized protein n=1 Tax=Streptomyces radicis TaxID=1750517 RepID=A0A3A9WGX8_9ACTN|nr:hypothetical protein D7319_06445 [Streptomyces radicis]RKN26419.1 hypothetical protein D7318_03215 [Streptomyces radicis]
MLGLAAALTLTPTSAALASAALTGPTTEVAGESHAPHHTTDAPRAVPQDTGSVETQLKKVRAATVRYQDVRLAEADGYTLGESCIPGLGYHFVRQVAESQDELEITEPNSMLYVPQEDGSLKLAGVGYVSKREAALFGEELSPPSILPYYTLHAWVWEENPNGVFEHINPNISCPGKGTGIPAPEGA